MPPKAASRRAAPSTASESQAKKAKTPKTSALPKSKSSKRWAAVSGSRNAENEYRSKVQHVSHANEYVCIPKPHFNIYEQDNASDEESEGDSEGGGEDNEAEPKPAQDGDDTSKCESGGKCGCLEEPASKHPGHRWIVTWGGHHEQVAQNRMASLRNPNFFDMYTFNDHEAYGVLEVVQNTLLDWVEAETWQEQWRMCEGLILFLVGEGSMFYMIDDGQQADEVAKLVGRLFLTMLARLEAQGLLSETSEIKNLGLIMTLYIKFAADMRIGCLLEKEEEETNPSRFT